MIDVKIWAHRGASGWDRQYAPENTMPAFEKAVEMQADGIELDVQLTRDGEVVICHDERLERTSNGQGWLKNYSLSELKKLDFHANHLEYGFVEIPTLAEFLQFMRSNELEINIELKNSVIFYSDLEKKVLEIVARYGLEERVIYSSFNHYSLLDIKKINPVARIGVLAAEEIVDFPQYAQNLRAEAVHPVWYSLYYGNFIAECKKRNLAIHTWVVDNKEKLREIAKMRVEAIITDCPDNAREVLSSMKETVD